ncbi:FIST C-terminal domain-containing protein [Sulfurospirillum sp. T05]|uniref:histidine kinase n=1 Tax=Sulfurospirillum tamanense TaxID=2813362 RepID=A0ABS2WUZ3_9BACT|nr:FIST C-terminal domain-containing protein [Sulfurospirillum tamanensis]
MKIYTYRFVSHEDFALFIAQKELGLASNIFVMCYSGIDDQAVNQEILYSIKSLLPQASIMGSTTDGEIFETEVMVHSFVLSLTTFESTTLEIELFSAELDSFKAGQMIAHEGVRLGAKVAIIVADGIVTNGDYLMDGVNSIAPSLVVAGGLAGDNGRYEESFIFCDTHIKSKAIVVGYLVSETLEVYHTKSFNWAPMGPKFKVTRADKNCIYTVDNISVLELYRKYLGSALAQKLPQGGIEFPFVFYKEGHLIGRAPIRLNGDGSVVFAGNISEGEIIQFGFGDIDAILADAKEIIADLAEFGPEKVMVFSCMTRKNFLGEDAYNDFEGLSSVAPTTGFFTYGEFFHDSDHKCNFLLNETMTVLGLKEVPPTTKGNVRLLAMAPKKKGISSHRYSETFNALLHIGEQTALELGALNSTLNDKVDEAVRRYQASEELVIIQARSAIIGEMLSIIAHQWRQPLSIIGMVIGKMRIGALSAKEKDEALLADIGVVDRNINYLSDTIEDFRNFFKPKVEKEWHSASMICEQLRSLADPILKMYNINLEIKLNDEKKFFVYGSELVQVLLSLVSNSKDAILEQRNENGKITIVCEYKALNAMYRFSVFDNGGSIAANMINVMFEPYVSSKGITGTGLGLYMAKTIIEKHFKGKITSKNTEDGARITIDFPIETKEVSPVEIV